MTNRKTKSRLSQAEFARQRGVTRQRISQYVASGMPIGDDGKISPATAEKWIAKNIEARVGKTPSLVEARIRDTEASAILKELEIRKRKGELVEIEDVRNAWNSILSVVRSNFLLLPSKLGHKLAIESDPKECTSLIDKAVRETLRAITEHRFEEGSK